MLNKPPFTDLIKSNRSFWDFGFLRLAIMIVVVAVIMTGVMIFKDSGHLVSQRKKQIQKMVANIQNLEKEISEKQNDVLDLLFKYKQKTGKEFSYLHILNLSEQEKRILENRIREEKRITIKSLLQAILEKSAEIMKLQAKMATIEAKMPEPFVVQDGQNHYQIALHYLEKTQGLNRQEALRLAENAALVDQLIPGFRVWNYYNQGVFASFVTQGEASCSPGYLQKKAKQMMVSQTRKLREEKDRLSDDNQLLKTKNTGLHDQINRLSENYGHLSGKYSVLNEQYNHLDKEWNSLYYRLDLKKHLIKQGMIKRGFLTAPDLKQFSISDFNHSLDLRTCRQIYVAATQVNDKKIKNLVLYPRYFKKGVDYEVSVVDEGSSAVLTILNPEKLKNERVVISVD